MKTTNMCDTKPDARPKAKWKNGVPNDADLPIGMKWVSVPSGAKSLVLGEKEPGLFVWALIVPGFVWYVYETSVASHEVKKLGGLVSEARAKAQAEEEAIKAMVASAKKKKA